MFKHFDKIQVKYLYILKHSPLTLPLPCRSGRLDHPEFKACLRSLGFDLAVPVEGEPDHAFEAILDAVDRDRDGFVRLEEYMQVRVLTLILYSRRECITRSV